MKKYRLNKRKFADFLLVVITVAVLIWAVVMYVKCVQAYDAWIWEQMKL